MIVYLVLAHHRLGQLGRLIRRLAGPDTAFAVHIDARTDLRTEVAHLELLTRVPRLSLLPRHRTPWGGIGLVRATLAGLAHTIQAHPGATHICVLSGQDYPIKPPAEIRDFFRSHVGDSFIEHHSLPRPGWEDGGLWRIADHHLHVSGRRMRLPLSRLGLPRRVPCHMTPYQGGQFWTMSRECAVQVCSIVDENPSLLRFFRHTAFPDESFFQTVAMASPAGSRIVNDDMRFERWEDDAPHPAVLTVRDLPDLAASDRLFAKKFDVEVDSDVLDEIDASL